MADPTPQPTREEMIRRFVEDGPPLSKKDRVELTRMAIRFNRQRAAERQSADQEGE